MLTAPPVGPYELLRPLGAGGMAETFVAIRRGPEGFEQQVCLKRILPRLASDAAFVDLFLDEARLLARLRCASIVQVYDFGESGGSYYMALELVDGADLDALIDSRMKRGERLPEDVALFIATQVLAALDYAHAATVDGQPLNIVHRDVSPANILISMHGEVKLSDFGIAKSHGRRHTTRTGRTRGKAAYMSPEQVRGEALDGRSDLFAVGVLLYEMLTGTHPFEASTDLRLLNNILAGRRRAITELLPDASPALVAFLDSLLGVRAADRPRSGGDALRMIPMPGHTFVTQSRLAALMTEHRATLCAGPEAVQAAGLARGGDTEITRVLLAIDGPDASLQTVDLPPPTIDSSPPAGRPARHTWSDASLTVLRRNRPWARALAMLALFVTFAFAGDFFLGKMSGKGPPVRKPVGRTMAAEIDIPTVHAPVNGPPALPPTPGVGPGEPTGAIEQAVGLLSPSAPEPRRPSTRTGETRRTRASRPTATDPAEAHGAGPATPTRSHEPSPTPPSRKNTSNSRRIRQENGVPAAAPPGAEPATPAPNPFQVESDWR